MTYVGGTFYLNIFIAIGAFVFANLVVAVVVTNLVSDGEHKLKTRLEFYEKRENAWIKRSSLIWSTFYNIDSNLS